MNKKHILIFLSAGIVILLLVAGCVKPSSATIEDETKQHTHIVWTENNIKKITIPEDNVTCYTSSWGYGGGISCLRDEVQQ